jgi:hypothetical protein
MWKRSPDACPTLPCRPSEQEYGFKQKKHVNVTNKSDYARKEVNYTFDDDEDCSTLRTESGFSCWDGISIPQSPSKV